MRIASNLTCIHVCTPLYLYNAVDPFTLHHISRGLQQEQQHSTEAAVCARVVVAQKKYKSYIIIDMSSTYIYIKYH